MATGLDIGPRLYRSGRSLPPNATMPIVTCAYSSKGSSLPVSLGQEPPWPMNFHMNEYTPKEQGWEPKGGMHTFHNHLFLFILQENLRTYDADRWWYFLAGLLGLCYKAAFHLCNCEVITWFLKEMLKAFHLAHIPFSVWNSNELTLLFFM